jgi:lipoprotein-anchoring transpeptidase ErfK/SrfK
MRIYYLYSKRTRHREQGAYGEDEAHFIKKDFVMIKFVFTTFFTMSLFGFASASASARAATSSNTSTVDGNAPNIMDELNPFDPNIEQVLKTFDTEQEAATGMPSQVDGLPLGLGDGLPKSLMLNSGCYRANCAVWAHVVKSSQAIYIYLNGAYTAGYKVSTGIDGLETPDFDTHPDGRIYDKYTSKKFPEGDYNGLGNMPYAVFISGGFAIHGTTLGNVPKLGRRASHGCIRVHPDVGFYFNRLVRQTGVRNVWITVD